MLWTRFSSPLTGADAQSVYHLNTIHFNFKAPYCHITLWIIEIFPLSVIFYISEPFPSEMFFHTLSALTQQFPTFGINNLTQTRNHIKHSKVYWNGKIHRKWPCHYLPHEILVQIFTDTQEVHTTESNALKKHCVYSLKKIGLWQIRPYYFKETKTGN